MLRVGLTGSLGSGKSTAGRLFVAHGAHLLQSDAIGRDLMQPGQPAFAPIVQHFGPSVLTPADELDRAQLARLAFANDRVEELNAIIHPLVIARQAELAQSIAHQHPDAVVLIESALIFETRYSEPDPSEPAPTENKPANTPWRNRLDKLILVTASEETKVARYIARCAAGSPLTPQRHTELEAEAHRRLAHQIPDEQKAALCDYVLTNNGPLTELEWQVDQLWPRLQQLARSVQKTV